LSVADTGCALSTDLRSVKLGIALAAELGALLARNTSHENLRITLQSGAQHRAAGCTADAGYRIIRRAGAPLTLLTPE
jgi:hypothetical protein